MTTAELYAVDPTFRDAIAGWVEHRRCDLRLVDYLIEAGLEAQAEAARWAATYRDREQADETIPCGQCGPYPVRVDVTYYWYTCEHDRHAHDLPSGRTPFCSMWINSHTNRTAAILWLLDNMAPELEPVPEA